LIRFRFIFHFDKRETARLPGIAISNYIHAIDRSVRLEQRPDVLLGGLKTEIPNKNILHLFSFSI